MLTKPLSSYRGMGCIWTPLKALGKACSHQEIQNEVNRTPTCDSLSDQQDDPGKLSQPPQKLSCWKRAVNRGIKRYCIQIYAVHKTSGGIVKTLPPGTWKEVHLLHQMQCWFHHKIYRIATTVPGEAILYFGNKPHTQGVTWEEAHICLAAIPGQINWAGWAVLIFKQVTMLYAALMCIYYTREYYRTPTMVWRMWQKRNPALWEITGCSHLPNEITSLHGIKDGALMKTLLDVGSETSIIAQNFVTSRELWIEPMATSEGDGCLKITTCGNANVCSPHYVGVCVGSNDPVKTGRYVIMLVIPTIQSAKGRVDTILGADMLWKILRNQEDRTIPKWALPSQGHMAGLEDEIKHLAWMGIIDVTQVLGYELLLVFSRKDGTRQYAQRHPVTTNDPAGYGEVTQDLDLHLAYWQIRAVKMTPLPLMGHWRLHPLPWMPAQAQNLNCYGKLPEMSWWTYTIDAIWKKFNSHHP